MTVNRASTACAAALTLTLGLQLETCRPSHGSDGNAAEGRTLGLQRSLSFTGLRSSAGLFYLDSELGKREMAASGACPLLQFRVRRLASSEILPPAQPQEKNPNSRNKSTGYTAFGVIDRSFTIW